MSTISVYNKYELLPEHIAHVNNIIIPAIKKRGILAKIEKLYELQKLHTETDEYIFSYYSGYDLHHDMISIDDISSAPRKTIFVLMYDNEYDEFKVHTCKLNRLNDIAKLLTKLIDDAIKEEADREIAEIARKTCIFEDRF